jgi:hypothetical protein
MESKTRFVVMGALTMLDLVNSMNAFAHPLARLVYYGENKGDYSASTEREKIEAAKYIAVFDFSPVQIFEVENITLVLNNGNNDTSNEVSPNDKITMSA